MTFTGLVPFRCVEEAKLVFPDRVSVDLMFGRPGQTLETWTQELNQVISQLLYDCIMKIPGLWTREM